MNEGKTVSLCITNFNRFEWVIRSFHDVLYDDRISEIVISDDASDLSVFKRLENAVGGMDKVKLFRNETNKGCYHNKKRAIELATNEWVIILDSDNIIGTDYLDVIFEQYWDEKKIMAPQFGRPALDYSQWAPLMFSAKNVAGYLDKGNFQMLLNTFNFFINRGQFLKVFDDGIDPITSDSIFFCYCWFKFGNYLHVVPNLQYYHRVHPESHYTTNCHKLPGFYDNLLQSIRQLK